MRNSRYVLTWLLVLAAVFPTLPTNAGDAVPVLMWGGGEPNGSPFNSVNPLLKTSQDEFAEIVEKKVGGSQYPILVFVRDNLCVEDFTQHKEGLMHLKDDGSLVYLPAVDSPMFVFENMTSYNQSHEEELETILDGQLVITKATDLDAVSETYNMVKESSPNLIAALTGRSCTYSRSERVRRAVPEESSTAEPKADDLVEYIQTPRILIYYADTPNLTITEEGVSESTLQKVEQEGAGTWDSPLALHFLFEVKNTTSPFNASIVLELNMNSTAYYTAQAFFREGDNLIRLVSESYFTFPYNASYHCSGKIRFYQKQNKEKHVQGIDFLLSNFQIQVDAKNSSFSHAFDCVGFTSAPIWSGIFVTLILGMIMVWGLVMIMDIRTMDRFDDPKGKSITITASE